MLLAPYAFWFKIWVVVVVVVVVAVVVGTNEGRAGGPRTGGWELSCTFSLKSQEPHICYKAETLTNNSP